jgi:WD40 repeat protein
VAVVGVLSCTAVWQAAAQETPRIVWEAPTPSGLANSVMGISWSAGKGAQVAVGSTDRWVRARQAGNGILRWSALQPIRSGGADQTIFSTDAQFLAVHNSSSGLAYRIHRAGNGLFLGTITASLDGRGLVVFSPDADLVAATGGDGTLTRWRLADFKVVKVEGVGYHTISTTFNFSPDGSYQSAATQGKVTVQRRTDGAVVRVLPGGSLRGGTPVTFTPDSASLAVWASSPNETTLWRLADGTAIGHFPGAIPEEGVTAIRFTPDGTRLVTTGYLPHEDPVYGWQQTGIIRFWRAADGALRHQFSTHTGIAVTSPVAWSWDASQFAFGTYEGAVAVAWTPDP